MEGIVNLEKLLENMTPELVDGEFVFCCVKGRLHEYLDLNPLASFRELEGLTLIILKDVALANQIAFEGCFRQITLTVHSSLNAVGLTAAVATKLTEHNISANVVAAYFHDHIFVQSENADKAIAALLELQADR